MGRRVLLVENCMRGMSATFSQFVREAGGRVKMNMSSSIKDASYRLGNGGYDLILLSLHLLDCEGVEVLNKLLPVCGNTPIGVLLNHDEHHLEQEVRSMGALGTFRTGEVNIDGALELCSEPVDSVQPDAKQTQHNNETLPEELTVPDGEQPEEIFDTLDVSAEIINDESEDSELKVSEPVVAQTEAIGASILESVDDQAGRAGDAVVQRQVEASKVIEQDLPVQDNGEVATDDSCVVNISADDVKGFFAAQSEATEQFEPEGSEVDDSEVIGEHALALKDFEGAIKVLEERCRELEAGQTALIEAEHVAIEREKKARLAAEERIKELEARLLGQSSVDKLEKECSKLEKMLEDARAREKELVSVGELEEAKSQNILLQERIDALGVQTARITELETQLSSQDEQLALRERRINELSDKLQEKRETSAALVEKSAAQVELLKTQFDASEKLLKDCQWQLAQSLEKNEALGVRVAELEEAVVEVSRSSEEIDGLKLELVNAQSRRGKLEEELAAAAAEKLLLGTKISELQSLVNRLHVLADRAADFDALTEQLEYLKFELTTEQAARRRLGTQLRKAKSREQKLELLEKSLIDLEWQVHVKEEELAGAEARVEELEIGAADADLIRENNELKRRVDALEKENRDFIQKQMIRVEELTELYEKAQMERLELSSKLAEISGK